MQTIVSAPGIAVFGLIITALLGVIAKLLITSRSKIQARTDELRRQEMLNSRLVESLADAVVACDADGQLTLFNKAARNWHGMDLREIPKEKWAEYYDLYHKDGITPLSTEEVPLVRALRGEQPRDIEMSVAAKGCDLRFVLASGDPIVDTDGTNLGAVIVMRDLTERRQAQQAVVDQERFLKETINLSPNFVFAKDRDGRFVMANDATARFYNMTVQELIGRSMGDIHSYAEEVDHFREQEQSVLTTGEDRIADKERVTDIDGNEHRFDTVRRPIRSADGSCTLVLAVSTDVTQQYISALEVEDLNRTLESRVAKRTDSLQSANKELDLARKEAEQANRAKSTFLASMSHEIRTPMNGVLGMVEVLAQSVLNADQQELVKTVQDSSLALLGLIDNILDFSKIEAGHLDIERNPVMVANFAETACLSLLQLADEKDVDLSLYVDEKIPFQIYSDETRLLQVFFNLVGNAIKFSGGREEQRGRVTARIVMSTVSQDNITFSIKDNGIGMTTDAVDGLFDAFRQAETSTTRRFGGTGLGLAICRRLVDLMGGEIDVQSSLGRGSVFTVTLPVEAVNDAYQKPLPDLAGVDCIVLPGDFATTAELGAYVEPAGARVHVAKSLNDAVRLAKSLESPVIVAQDSYEDDADVLMDDAQDKQGSDSDTPMLLLRSRRQMTSEPDDNTVTYDAAILTQPRFLNAVALVAGRTTLESTNQKSLGPALRRPRSALSIAEARDLGRLVLVAEDDSVNQRVILRQLAILGYAAEVASNGIEALDMWRKSKYALILTDLHMPEMDGYALAAAIRAEEGQSERIPILALTANALRGEASRAKEAGMDDYITKPVRLNTLESNLATWLNSDLNSGAESSFEHAVENDHTDAADTSLLDLTVLTDFLGGDEDCLNELLTDFLQSAKDVARELHLAGKSNDMPKMAAAAHRLKSSARTVGALSLGDVCADLENACRSSDHAAARQCTQTFESLLVLVEAEISSVLDRKKLAAGGMVGR